MVLIFIRDIGSMPSVEDAKAHPNTLIISSLFVVYHDISYIVIKQVGIVLINYFSYH